MRLTRIMVLLVGIGFAGVLFSANDASATQVGIAVGKTFHHSNFGFHHSNFGFHRYPFYGYRSFGYYPYYRFGFYSPFYYPYYSPFYGYGYGGYGYGGYGYGGGYYSSGRYYGYGEVRTEIKPKEAKVYVDGDYVGEVDDYDGWWQRLHLEPGRHRLVFRAPGYKPYAVTLRILPGEDYHIKEKLQPGQDYIDERDMRLERDSRKDGQFNYDRGKDPKQPYGYGNPNSDREYGTDKDQGNENDQNYENNRGYENTQPGYENNGGRYDQGVPDENNSSEKRSVVLQVEPRDATIYIDGNYYGTGDVNQTGEVQVLLPEGVHRIEVVRPGYESYSKEIHVNSKYSERILVSLKKK